MASNYMPIYTLPPKPHQRYPPLTLPVPFGYKRTVKKRNSTQNPTSDTDGFTTDATTNVETTDGEDISDEEETTAPPKPILPPAFIPRSTKEQYALAGLPLGTPLPPPPFPVAPANPKSENILKQARREIAKYQPNLYNAIDPLAKDGGPESKVNSHLGVLMTIIHKSILSGDIKRADKAFSLLIRATSAGPKILRRRDVVGLGAHILLLRRGEDDSADLQEGEFEDKAFDNVQRYFERLTIQYPVKSSLAAASQLSFQAAAFGFAIYAAVQRTKVSKRRLGEDMMDVDDQTDELDRIQEVEYDAAHKIATQIDELLVSPPFDKDPEMLNLRGMVARWVADLTTDSEESEQELARAEQVFEKAKEAETSTSE
jgi:hypothetical protein